MFPEGLEPLFVTKGKKIKIYLHFIDDTKIKIRQIEMLFSFCDREHQSTILSKWRNLENFYRSWIFVVV